MLYEGQKWFYFVPLSFKLNEASNKNICEKLQQQNDNKFRTKFVNSPCDYI